MEHEQIWTRQKMLSEAMPGKSLHAAKEFELSLINTFKREHDTQADLYF